MAHVSLRNLIKKYGDVQVMHGVSLDIKDGEFVILVGPSGCGKSTLLRMIAGLEDISGGEISIEDVVVNDVEPKARDIAMVFQNYALYPHMTVRQNMGYSLKIKGVPVPERNKQVEAAADILGLRDLLDRKPKQLSGGQRQRVAMGRAIVRNPKVFLFDEPLSNLDAKLRVAMRAEIKALHHKLQTTIVYVTHDQIEAMTMADRIVVMNAGNVEQVGTPLELYDNPQNMFVASFIGSPAMNMLAGQIVDQDGDLGVQISPDVTWSANGSESGTAGREVVYGVRPEHFRLSENGEKGLQVEVEVIEPTGSETQVIANFGDQKLTILFRDRVAMNVGDKISLSPMQARVHLFDKSSGKRLDPQT